jgi:predicted permease
MVNWRPFSELEIPQPDIKATKGAPYPLERHGTVIAFVLDERNGVGMSLIKDTRFAVRSLLRTPGFSSITILTLGLGIGMSVAVWSVFDAVLIEPLPYPDANRIVEIGLTLPEIGTAGYPMSALDYLDYAERNRSFQAMAAVFRENLNLTGGSSPARVNGARVSAPFFTVMGVSPQLGRAFRDEEDAPGRDLVAVISNSLWQRTLGGRSDVLGRTVVVNGLPHIIVGVAPEGFDYPRNTEIWLPIAIDPETEDRAHGWVVPIGRLRSGVQMADARTDLEAIREWIEREHVDSREGRRIALQPLKERIVGNVRPSLLVLLAAVACVLLIAAANATILLSVRTSARERELTMRHALGASRGHLVRLVMAEGLVLALCGGAVGLVFAHWCIRAIGLQFSEFIPRSDSLGMDAGIFAFAVLVSAAVGLLAGFLPAIRSREDRIMARLRETDRSTTGGSSAVGTAMVVTEIALSVVLLAGAVLLIRTSINLLRVDPGFESDRVMTAEISLTDERYAEESARRDFYRRALEDIGSIPEVEAVGSVYPLPLFGRRISTRSYVDGAPFLGPDEQQPLVELRFVSPGYFEAAGLHLVAGRFLNESDTADSPAVVVVNESFVRQLVPHGEPVGRRTTGLDPADPETQWETIVGVVRNVRHINLAEDTGPEMYIPVDQSAFEWATFVVRARSGTAEMLANPIREAIQRIDPELPVFNVQTMTDVVNRSMARTRVVTALLALFASVGLALAGVGVFSVVSYSVGRRVHEVAVRMAIGGTPRKVVALIMRKGLIPVTLGFLLGSATALALTRFLASRLYGVAAHDPMTYAGVALIILAIAALAVWLPARRASRVEPMAVLRSE